MNNNEFKPGQKKTPVIIASLSAGMVAVIALSLYLKGRSGSTPTIGTPTHESADVSKTVLGKKAEGKQDAPSALPMIAEVEACKLLKMKPADGKGTYRKNLLMISDAELNPKTICVKVDGTPVKFDLYQKKANQILIGGVRGPKAEIIVRYCKGKQLCKEDCKIPRDEFMDAITGGDSGDEAARWDDSKETDSEKRVAHEMNVFKEDMKAIEAKAMANMSKWEAKDAEIVCRADGKMASRR